MLILQNFNIQASKKSFRSSSSKFLKISINEHIVTSKQAARVRSATNIQWKQKLSLPYFTNAKYTFQIFEKHSFGYNPQQLGTVGGTITIAQQDSYGSWDIKTDKDESFGMLSANIRLKAKYMSSPAQQLQIVTIRSIIVHSLFITQKRGFVRLKINNKHVDTDINKCKSGQLVFIQEIQFQKSDQMKEAELQLYEYDAKQQKSELIATGKFILDSLNLKKRVILINNKETQAGDVFIDHDIIAKKDFYTNKQLCSILKKSKLLSRINDYKTASQSIQNSYFQYIKQNNSIINNATSNSRKINPQKRKSVIHHNQNIFTPTQDRFKAYHHSDNPCRQLSHLSEADRDFDFMEKHSKQYYKGASIGKGKKYDFTGLVKSNPGVGGYHLPSIWDRY